MIAASENWNLLAFDHGSWMTYFLPASMAVKKTRDGSDGEFVYGP